MKDVMLNKGVNSVITADIQGQVDDFKTVTSNVNNKEISYVKGQIKQNIPSRRTERGHKR